MKISQKYEKLEKEIKGTTKAINEDRLKLVRVKKDLKVPQDNDYYHKKLTLNQLMRHNGNFGVCVGYNHKKKGSSIACVDIDGFKFKTMTNAQKKTLSSDTLQTFEAMTEEQLEEIAQESKKYILNCLIKHLESPMVSETQSKGFHVFLFNETLPPKDQQDKDHYLSKRLKFPLDCPIKELRGVPLVKSIEMFSYFTQKQIILPSSEIKGKDGEIRKYKLRRGEKLSKDWGEVGTVSDINKSIKDSLIMEGFLWNEIKEIAPKYETESSEYKGKTSSTPQIIKDKSISNEEFSEIEEDLSYYIGEIIAKTEGKHNLIIKSLAHALQSRGVSLKQSLTVFRVALEDNDPQHKKEHLKQVSTSYKSKSNKKTGFKTILNEDNALKPLIDGIGDTLKPFTIEEENLEAFAPLKKKALEVEKLINLRKNPVSEVDNGRALRFEETIREEGLIEWLESRIHNIFIGDLRNIYRKTLGAFNVARGYDSYYFATEGGSGVGKSMEDETVLNDLVPSLYVIKMNAPTYASFTRDGGINELYYNRTLLYVGDIGRKDDMKEFMEIAKVYKILISEGEYTRKITAEDKKSTIELKLKTESCACIYSTTKKGDEIDNQMRSRSLNSTPVETNEDDLMDFEALLEFSESPQAKAKKQAQKDLLDFKNYFLYKILDNREIINPWGSIFKRISKYADVPIREYKQLRKLFNAYCKLTSFECETTSEGYLVASEQQLIAFFENIALDSSMVPHIYEFLMLVINGQGSQTKKNKTRKEGYKVEMLDTDKETRVSSDLNFYISQILAEMGELFPISEYEDEEQQRLPKNKAETFELLEALDTNKTNIFYKLLMKKYRLRGEEGGVFFTVSDLNKAFRKYRAFKNVDNLKTVLYELYKEEYLGKLEDLYKNKTIYFLTKKCEKLGEPFDITTEDRNLRDEYMEAILEK